MVRYVTYKRVSTKRQGHSGLGLEAQERDIRLFLESYSEEPWEVVGDFIEVESGADAERPELAKAIELAKRERAVLLVAKLDRLSRKVSFIAALMEDPKLKLKVAQMPHADKFQLHVYAALAEQERDFISLRTKAALQEVKARAERENRKPNLGGLRDKTMKRNVVLKAQADERAARLRGVVAPLRDRGATLREIAAALNAAGLETPRGGQWQAMTVKRVLERLDAA
ncbi:Site-specific DNA recombinase [Tistlia consotensis]|uniref:Site-specific DNA recombinase n=1 Tax=Tistlia consotensis USBA 355 TaxID=560819 RepID=A0A1Y6C754_9PROT|nr:recombinase family protein [Tistlia consotensis]SMF40231.1 Site-specific DNA recombinase [Tistlia consotensis USBA 355]SNR75214.1 Site-specific DNA recombinase [Tistlia consotensis]